MFSTRVLRPIVGAFLAAHEAVQIHYLLLDRPVNLVDEGVDVAVRIAHLPDSGLVALRVGEIRRIVWAAPAYLAGRPPITRPADLATHACIAVSQSGQRESWTFPPVAGGSAARIVSISPRLTLNASEAAVIAAVDGEGVIRVLSYQAGREIREGRLVRLLHDDEPPPLPVHIIVPEGRLAIAKVRAFVHFAAARLRAEFTRMSRTA